MRTLAWHLWASVKELSSVNVAMVTLVMFAPLMEYWYPETHSVGIFGNSSEDFRDATPLCICNSWDGEIRAVVAEKNAMVNIWNNNPNILTVSYLTSSSLTLLTIWEKITVILIWRGLLFPPEYHKPHSKKYSIWMGLLSNLSGWIFAGVTQTEAWSSKN